ncbi:hypothetical protein JZ751_006033 [Albula glossodonta]|uniref:Uncharacterized protein n=1 Tax=Albula glossodonta TaxID=121402 RepID=A0A8T2P625_9TELE|nr:hypothetical protein JZ751_006033 [Albula glossodonta]
MAAPASTLPPHVQSLPPPSLSSASTAPVISSPAPVHNAPPLMVPNPPHQRDPAPPTGFPSASHSLEPPSFNGANPCLPGVIPQLGIAPGPSTPPVLPEHLSHPHAPSPSLPHHGSMPFQQIPNIFQDPLYPGFPLNDKEERVPPPPFSCMRNGQDLPREMNVLRFFFNLGVKAFTNPGWAPQLYLYPLQQAYAMHPKMPFVTSWYHDTPPPGPVLCVNSMPASAMAVQDSYGHSGGYGHAIAGGRASGQFDQPHCQVQPGPGMGMLGMSLAPPHPDLSQGSDSRSNLRYSPQPPASLPPHMGGIPWHGPRPGTYPGAYPTHPPPPHLPPPHHPPPTQYLSPSPQFPPVSLGYPVPRLASGAPMVATVPQVSSADGPAGKVIIQTLAEGPAGMPSPAPERERGKEKRVTTPPMNSQPPADVPTEQAPSMEELTETSSCAESKVGSGYAHSTANPSDTPGLPLTLPPDKVNICLKEEVRSIVVSQEAANEGRSNDREATVAAGGNSPEVPVQSAVPSSDPQPYNMAYTPSEVWEEEGEPSEATLQSGRSYYSRSFRGRRGHDDGRGYRDNRWRGEGRGYRGRRGPDDRRDYNYRDRRVEYYPSYPSTNKGQNSRGRGRGYNQYANGRETSYTVVNQRNHNYAES